MDDAVELYLDIDLDRFLELLKVSSLTKHPARSHGRRPTSRKGYASSSSARSRTWAKTTSSAELTSSPIASRGTSSSPGEGMSLPLCTRSGGQTYVLVKCQDPAARDSSFAHVVRRWAS